MHVYNLRHAFCLHANAPDNELLGEEDTIDSNSKSAKYRRLHACPHAMHTVPRTSTCFWATPPQGT